MALKIRSTPVLSGKTAEHFIAKLDRDRSKRIDFSFEVLKAKRIINKSKLENAI